MACGYDLVGLREDALCPECGEPVRHSLTVELLAHLPLNHLRFLMRGCGFIQWGMVLFGISVPLAFVQQSMLRSMFLPGAFAISLFQYLGVVLTALGWSHLTTPKGQWWRGRLASRAILIRGASGAILVLESIRAVLKLMEASPFPWDWPLEWNGLNGHLNGASFYLVQLACVVRFFASITLLREYARRVPSRSIESAAKALKFALPLLMVPGFLLCGLGPIIAWALYLGLVSDLRFALKRLVVTLAPP